MFGTILGMFSGISTRILVGVALAGVAFGGGMYLEHKIAAGKAAQVQAELARQRAEVLQENESLKEAVLARDAKIAEKDKVLEAAFPLLQQGDGNGSKEGQPGAAKPAVPSLESLLGKKE